VLEQLGKYELINKIGQGGMAEVFLARASLAQGLHKLVVVKKIHAAFSKSSHFARMFRTEAQIATWLNHPNIVQVFYYGKEGDELYLVMEYVEGFDLMRNAGSNEVDEDHRYNLDVAEIAVLLQLVRD